MKEIISIAVTGLASSFDSACLYSNEEKQQHKDYDYRTQNEESAVNCEHYIKLKLKIFIYSSNNRPNRDSNLNNHTFY